MVHGCGGWTPVDRRVPNDVPHAFHPRLLHCMALLSFCIRRILQTIPMMFGLLTLVFVLSRMMPGDAADLFLAPGIPPAVAGHLRHQFGLDRPVIEQYIDWMTSAAVGDFGYSLSHAAPVSGVIGTVFPHTVLLGIAALVLEMFLAATVVTSVWMRAGVGSERFLSWSSLVLYTIPPFWLGMLLLSVFAYQLGLLPAGQLSSGRDLPLDLAIPNLLSHLVLPALTLAVPGAAMLVRYWWGAIAETRSSGFVLAARAAGLSPGKVFRSAVLPSSLGPALSVLGLEIGVLFGGVIVTETLFAWPGLGRVSVMAVFSRDYPLLLGCTVVAGLVVVAGNALADIAVAILDPRRRADT